MVEFSVRNSAESLLSTPLDLQVDTLGYDRAASVFHKFTTDVEVKF